MATKAPDITLILAVSIRPKDVIKRCLKHQVELGWAVGTAAKVPRRMPQELSISTSCQPTR